MFRRSGLGLACGLLLACSVSGSVPAQEPPGFVGSLTLDSDDPLFGGFSALEVSADGARLLLLSDRGAYAWGQITRDPAGRLTSVRVDPVSPMKGRDAKDLFGTRADSEGLAMSEDGTFYVSFEVKTRVARYDRIGGAAAELPAHADFANLPSNGSLEALAIDAAGTLYAVPEAPAPGPSIPVYVLAGSAWQKDLSLPSLAGFRAVAADFGPDGRFYLLERRFHGYRGFSSRLRRFTLTAGGFSKGEVLLETSPGLHDNLEGLSVWRAPDGLRATMISDDNFFPLQITEIVEYHLPD